MGHILDDPKEIAMENDTITADITVDTRGLSCPMPLLKTKKALKGLKPGQVLEVLGTDPGSKKDIPDFGAKNGNSFLGMRDEDQGVTRYYIRKN
jgi:tRNA 2-thiouridine synthesizing protein A